MAVKDAERIRKPKLPKKRILKKAKKGNPKPRHPHNGGAEPKPKREPRKRAVKFCPKCGSTDIFFASGLPQLRSLWDCRKCGYRGGVILEDGKLAHKLQEEYFKKVAGRGTPS